MGQIEVKGKAEKTVVYDLINVGITFHSREETPKEASEKVMRDCENFLSSFAKMGYDMNSVRLEKDYVSENTYYDNYDDSSKYSYLATRKVNIIMKYDMKLVNNIHSLLNYLSLKAEVSTNYEFSDNIRVGDELMQEALQNARQKAEKMAAAIGEEITGLISADQKSTDNSAYIGDTLCLSESASFLMSDNIELEEYEYTDQLAASEITLSESINTVWETKRP
ncbi:MAG: SIMPL domain-containing protein [Lachnospiraceae bacterium]|nr:SIMPL domain-containing protein [Lachnospiraceae bacterium]